MPRSGSAWRTAFPTYMLSSGLISAGMNWWQALITILLGNTIVLIPILLNSHPGHQVRNSLPGIRARSLRNLRIESPGADARDRRLRLVWHSGLDRRRGAYTRSSRAIIPGWNDACSAVRSGGHMTDRVVVVSAVLGPEHLHHLSRHGPAAQSRKLGRACSC